MDKKINIAESVRTFLTFHTHGVLATASLSCGGTPFGSLVPYDLTPEGDFVIYVSRIAEHYKNLMSDSRASVTILESSEHGDPQALARATAVLSFFIVPKEEEAVIRSSYESRFPKSINHELAHDFVFMRGRPDRIRWIGGFGNIAWISGDEFRNAVAEPISHFAQSAIRHMNEDHYSALVKMASKRGVTNVTDKKVSLVNVDTNGCALEISGNGSRDRLEFVFLKAVSTAEELRNEMIALMRTAG